jgi:hypothetical protein
VSETEVKATAKMDEAKPATLQMPVLLESNGITDKPTMEQLEGWVGRAQRMAPFGTTRQMVLAIEVEIWTADDKPVSERIVEAIEKYLELGTAIENGSEIVLKSGVSLRHRFINRYYRAGALIGSHPEAGTGPIPVRANDPRIQA